MIRSRTGILARVIEVMFLALAETAGMADRILEEIQRLTAVREAGGSDGN
ncbi:MAG: hypothetical protein HFH43_05705 [Lachnospiraceae bacterium]|jgi:hypothetical protein|nr:hypothetical protein [Lachnospiraceae bacterium]